MNLLDISLCALAIAWASVGAMLALILIVRGPRLADLLVRLLEERASLAAVLRQVLPPLEDRKVLVQRLFDFLVDRTGKERGR